MILRSAEDLARAGFDIPGAGRVGARYAIRLTPTVAGLIGDPDDPVARQYLPDLRELETRPEELADPIADEAHSPLPGLVHRYPDRVLLKPVSVCPVYCRFCFRRETVGPGRPAPGPAETEAALDYIRARPEVFEVILSGGDPLMMAPARLGRLVGALDDIPHVGAIRLHSRVPVADPGRVTDALARALDVATAVTVAVHCNHARELVPEAVAACRRLRRAGVATIGQSVLLEGVNADEESLEALFRALMAAGVRPYYLHHPDLAPGTGHFRLPIERGRALMAALRGRVSGLPLYVTDLPGGAGKVPLGPDHYEAGGVRDREGRTRPHPDHRASRGEASPDR